MDISVTMLYIYFINIVIRTVTYELSSYSVGRMGILLVVLIFQIKYPYFLAGAGDVW